VDFLLPASLADHGVAVRILVVLALVAVYVATFVHRLVRLLLTTTEKDPCCSYPVTRLWFTNLLDGPKGVRP
jgi:hypothetical protein